jgi:hypothetical protein
MSEINGTSKALPIAGSVVSTVAAAKLPQLDTGHAIRELILQADPGNTDNILIGNATAQVIVLEPGDDFTIALENPAECSHKAASGNQRLNFLGRD